MNTVVKFFYNPVHGWKCTSCNNVYTVSQKQPKPRCCDAPVLEKYWERNKFISRTLRKIAVVREGQADMITDTSWWLVKIDKEQLPMQAKGCFILSLIKKLEDVPDLLVTGMFTERVTGGSTPGTMSLIVDPLQRFTGYYTLPKDYRKVLSVRGSYTSIVVNHGGDKTWEAT